MLNNIAKEINCVLLKKAKLKWFKIKKIRRIARYAHLKIAK